jgi:hypothetical protein
MIMFVIMKTSRRMCDFPSCHGCNDPAATSRSTAPPTRASSTRASSTGVI